MKHFTAAVSLAQLKVWQTEAGNYQIDLLLANVCKQNVTRFPYEIVRLAEDIAGGLMVTMPSETDFKSDMKVGKQRRNYRRDLQQVLCCCSFMHNRRENESSEIPRKHVLRCCCCRVQNRVNAWRWFTTGSENHDLKTGQHRRKERAC